MIKDRGKLVTGLLAAALLLGAVCVSCAMRPEGAEAVSSEGEAGEYTTEDGLNELELLSRKNVADVEQELSEKEKIRRAEALDQENYDAVYEDAVIMGDSHMEGVSAYGFLDGSRVAAVKGHSLSNCDEDVTKAVSMSPNYIFMNYGMNDVGNYGSDPSKFIARYEEIITDIQKQLPYTEIIICSIFPAQDAAFGKKPALANIPAYNEALAEMCGRMGLKFIDTTSLMSDGDYEPDHIHTNAAFHKKWLAYVAVASGLVEQ